MGNKLKGQPLVFINEFGERNMLLFNLDNVLEYNRESQRIKTAGQTNLFSLSPEVKVSGLRLKETAPTSKREKLSWEKELLGLYVTEHPFQEYADRLLANRVTPLKNLTTATRNQIISVGGLVSGIQKIITRSGEPMLFVKLEDLTARTENTCQKPRPLARRKNSYGAGPPVRQGRSSQNPLRRSGRNCIIKIWKGGIFQKTTIAAWVRSLAFFRLKISLPERRFGIRKEW